MWKVGGKGTRCKEMGLVWELSLGLEAYLVGGTIEVGDLE